MLDFSVFYHGARQRLKNVYFFLLPREWQKRVARPNKWDEIESYLLHALVDPKRAAVDVGANVGKYALALSPLVPTVYAIEPSELANPMRRYFPKNVKVYAVAASDQAGVAQFDIPTFGDRVSIGPGFDRARSGEKKLSHLQNGDGADGYARRVDQGAGRFHKDRRGGA